MLRFARNDGNDGTRNDGNYSPGDDGNYSVREFGWQEHLLIDGEDGFDASHTDHGEPNREWSQLWSLLVSFESDASGL